MAPCGFGSAAALCGSLRVPEDRTRPDGRSIDLRVVLVPAEAPDAEPDPFVPLAGGPGGVATTDFTWLPAVFAAIHATRDIVLVDQRGTGGSNELTLPPFPDTNGTQNVEQRLATWAHAAFSALDADPREYTTAVAADDLDAVRDALGYERLDLYGPSYGATVAQYYLRQHADRVRVAVMDGGTPLDVPIFERVAANSARALDLLLDRCAADPSCHRAFPRVATELRAVFGRLQRPLATGLIDPATGKGVVLTRDDLASAIHTALLGSTTAAAIPLGIHLAYESRWQEIASLAGGSSSADDTSNLVMAAVIRCAEAWARFRPAEVSRVGAGSYLESAELASARSWGEACAVVPRGVVPPDDAAPVRSTVPVLWVVGAADPQDPPANLATVADELPNSRVIVVPDQGHTVGHLGCMPGVIARFVAAGSANALDASCIANGGVPAPAFLERP